MSHSGMAYLILVCVVFLIFVATMVWGMTETSHLPKTGDDHHAPPAAPNGHHH